MAVVEQQVLQDIKPMWQKVARRAQQHCRQQTGYAVMSMKVLIGPGGEPVFWFEPETKNIEPVGNPQMFLYRIMEQLAETP